MGRRSKLLNKDIRDNIIKLINDGNYIETACVACGITKQTFFNWLHKAESGGGGNGNQIYIDFFVELKKAEAHNIAENVKLIQEAGRKPQNWMASAWLLERKYPEKFGRRMELEVGPSKVLIALQERASKFIDTPKLIEPPSATT